MSLGFRRFAAPFAAALAVVCILAPQADSSMHQHFGNQREHVAFHEVHIDADSIQVFTVPEGKRFVMTEFTLGGQVGSSWLSGSLMAAKPDGDVVYRTPLVHLPVHDTRHFTYQHGIVWNEGEGVRTLSTIVGGWVSFHIVGYIEELD